MSAEHRCRCRQLGLRKYELRHQGAAAARAVAENPELFRMNEKGERTADACCVHSERRRSSPAPAAIGRGSAPPPAATSTGATTASPVAAAQVPRALASEQGARCRKPHLPPSAEADPEAQLARLAYVNSLARRENQAGPGSLPGIRADPAAARSGLRPAAGSARPRARTPWTPTWVFPKAPPRSSSTGRCLRFSVEEAGRQLPWNRDVFLADVAAYRSRAFATSPRSRHGSTPATGTGIKTWRSSRNMAKDY